MSDRPASKLQRGRRFWVVSPNVNNNLKTLEQWKELTRQNEATFMGWPITAPQAKPFVQDVGIGDIILVARGTNSKKRLVACGRVQTRALQDSEQLPVPPGDDLDYGSYRMLYPFKALAENPQECGLFFDGVQSPGQIPPAIYEIRQEDRRYPRNQEFCQAIESLLDLGSEATMVETELVQDLSKLLRAKKQIILQGPPGTGKTRTAKRIAASMLNIDLKEVEREERENAGLFKEARFSEESVSTSSASCWSIVQFHPSYNYEDFVRGIRPMASDGPIRYETQNRIFAKLARLAEDNPDQSVVLVIDEINRTNLGAVMGELIYALEYRGVPVTTPYAPTGSSDAAPVSAPKPLHCGYHEYRGSFNWTHRLRHTAALCVRAFVSQ